MVRQRHQTVFVAMIHYKIQHTSYNGKPTFGLPHNVTSQSPKKRRLKAAEEFAQVGQLTPELSKSLKATAYP